MNEANETNGHGSALVIEGAGGKMYSAEPKRNRKQRRTDESPRARTKAKARKGETVLHVATGEGATWRDVKPDIAVKDIVAIVADCLNDILVEKGGYDAAFKDRRISARQHKGEVYRLGCIRGGVERLAHRIGGPALVQAAHKKAADERQDDE